MKSTKLMMLPPFVFFALLTFAILLLVPNLILPFFVTKYKGAGQQMELISGRNTSHEIISEIGKRAELLSMMNMSAPNLARVLNSSLYGVNVSFDVIQDRVSPILYQAILTVPLVSEISYTGVDNLYFSYQYKDDQLLATYTNSSQFANMRFTQKVNLENGKLYGETTSLPVTTVHDFIFNQTAKVEGKGFVSLAFPAKTVAGILSRKELYGGYFCLASSEGKMILEGTPNTCMVNGEKHSANLTCDGKMSIKIHRSDYQVLCSALDILGVKSVYTLALPFKEKINHRNTKIVFILAIVALIAMIMSSIIFVSLILIASKREMYLCSMLIKEKETTEQAKTKELNKSLAFASASHDIRGSLAGITGLTEISQELVDPDSALGTNLKQIQDCTKYLMGILNTILDNSKIEAGKMPLEEVEFNVAELVEDVVDLYHPIGSKKGVDLILDPCDGSIFSKYSMVKGDQTKLRQILSNLVSNAVKCTNEGHIVVRGWAKKPSLKTPLFSSMQQSKSFGFRSCFFSSKNEEIYDEQNESRFSIQENPGTLEFLFEVDDTGPGIPIEKQKSIFENYVQVKKKDALEGTGLGLGIVQSLVRLMGGEIKIKDKKVGEKGTCFRFNIFLGKSETDLTNETSRETDLESQGKYSSCDSFCNSGPRPNNFSPKQERSRVVLFIQGEQRQKITRKFMERVGVEVSVVNEWHQLSYKLNKIKSDMTRPKYSSSSISDLSISSDKSIPLSSLDGADEMSHYLYRRDKVKNVSNFVLVIIDTSGGPFMEFCKAVAEFRKGLRNTCCRIAWVDKPGAQNMMKSKGLDEDKLPLTDLIISKPFHGSRLFHVIGLLPECGGFKRRKSRTQDVSDSPSNSRFARNDEDLPVSKSKSKSKGKEILSPEVQINDEILSGKKILVVDDNALQRKIASMATLKLGATVELCENGEEAVQLVSRCLRDVSKHRASTTSLPYDYIFMDCEMPVMDGFEATRRIRAEEGRYEGVHIPIIALTAHTTGEEANRMRENGIDYFLTKPLNKDKLIQVKLRFDTASY